MKQLSNDIKDLFAIIIRQETKHYVNGFDKERIMENSTQINRDFSIMVSPSNNHLHNALRLLFKIDEIVENDQKIEIEIKFDRLPQILNYDKSNITTKWESY